jgi:Putative metal-binding motif
MRPIMLLSATAVLSLIGCRERYTEVEEYYPNFQFSTSKIDFGEVIWGEVGTKTFTISNDGDLALGIESIEVSADEMGNTFALTWSADDIVCPDDGTEGEGAEDTAAAEAKEMDLDTGGGGGGGGTTDGGEEAAEVQPTLGSGCTLDVVVTASPDLVGTIYGSIVVTSVTETTDATKKGYYRDPDAFKQVILMEADAVRGEPNIAATRTLDFGFIWTGEAETGIVTIRNVGDGDLNLLEPEISATCDGAFNTTWSYWTDSDQAGNKTYVVEPGAQTMVEFTFTPEDQDAAYCSLTINSDDEDEPALETQIRGNSGTNPDCTEPTVAIRSPLPGYIHLGARAVKLELNVFDENQPATSLTCKIKSVMQEANIATCTPTDESGHIIVEIPVEDLYAGTDSLVVTVTNECERTAQASTTILYRATAPDSDDDGDGFGDDDGTDCDDTNSSTYPYAAEIYDGEDNDCDGEIDEETTGSDDDGDSFSEVDGDCDDGDDATYPGAYEEPDLKDNNCEGQIDEGTSLFDDDGDGFSETDNDCDDDDASVNPGAAEICDGLDNNCNGLRDSQEGCEATTSEPIIIGGVQMSARAVGVGQSVTMTVFSYDADGQTGSFAWQQDSDLTATGHNGISNPVAQTITWTAPSTLGESEGEVYSIYVVVTDPDGNQDWAFDEITVYPEPVELFTTTQVLEAEKGCGKSGGSALLIPLLPLFGLAAMRRRKS